MAYGGAAQKVVAFPGGTEGHLDPRDGEWRFPTMEWRYPKMDKIENPIQMDDLGVALF